MKNLYAMLNADIRAGKKLVFVVGYTENGGCTFTECDSLNDARRVKQQMTAEGRKPFIDAYTR